MPIRVIIECDGPVLDVEPVYWAAYSEAVAAVGLARIDPPRFWRLIRTGAPLEQALVGARKRQIATFQDRFDECLDSDTCLSCSRPQPDAGDALGRLARRGECVLVTVGRNRAARQKQLDEAQLSVHFREMHGLYKDPHRRKDQMHQLAGEHRRVLVAASTVPPVWAAAEAGVLCVGIHNGPATGRRLVQFGAAMSLADLTELADELDAGAPRLATHGLLPDRA